MKRYKEIFERIKLPEMDMSLSLSLEDTVVSGKGIGRRTVLKGLLALGAGTLVLGRAEKASAWFWEKDKSWKSLFNANDPQWTKALLEELKPAYGQAQQIRVAKEANDMLQSKGYVVVFDRYGGRILERSATNSSEVKIVDRNDQGGLEGRIVLTVQKEELLAYVPFSSTTGRIVSIPFSDKIVDDLPDFVKAVVESGFVPAKWSLLEEKLQEIIGYYAIALNMVKDLGNVSDPYAHVEGTKEKIFTLLHAIHQANLVLVERHEHIIDDMFQLMVINENRDGVLKVRPVAQNPSNTYWATTTLDGRVLINEGVIEKDLKTTINSPNLPAPEWIQRIIFDGKEINYSKLQEVLGRAQNLTLQHELSHRRRMAQVAQEMGIEFSPEKITLGDLQKLGQTYTKYTAFEESLARLGDINLVVAEERYEDIWISLYMLSIIQQDQVIWHLMWGLISGNWAVKSVVEKIGQELDKPVPDREVLKNLIYKDMKYMDRLIETDRDSLLDPYYEEKDPMKRLEIKKELAKKIGGNVAPYFKTLVKAWEVLSGIGSKDQNKDAAAVAMVGSSFERGGIDFDPGKLDLEVRNSGGGVILDQVPEVLARLESVSGFEPVVISIKPLRNVVSFLGLSLENLPNR